MTETFLRMELKLLRITNSRTTQSKTLLLAHMIFREIDSVLSWPLSFTALQNHCCIMVCLWFEIDSALMPRIEKVSFCRTLDIALTLFSANAAPLLPQRDFTVSDVTEHWKPVLSRQFLNNAKRRHFYSLTNIQITFSLVEMVLCTLSQDNFSWYSWRTTK
jgi:hypothetical protein